MAALYSPTAEKYVIGAMLRDTRAALLAIDKLKDQDFADPDVFRIFSAMRNLLANRQPVDMATVDAKIASLYGESAVKPELLVECSRSVPASANVRAYIQMVRESSVRRRLDEISNTLARMANDETADTAEAINEARNRLNALQTSDGQWASSADVMLAAYEDVERRAKGTTRPITFGLNSLDKLTGGIFPGELTVIGARPAVGKSAFAMQIALSAALQAGTKVCFASAEMVDTQIGQRMIARGSKINGAKLRTAEIRDDDWATMAASLDVYGQLPIQFLFHAKYIEDIAEQTRRQVENGACELLIVDYLQLLRSRQSFREDRLRVGHISKMLKDLTTDLKIPVIALAQVRRQNSGGTSRMPVLDDLRDSGAIEQDADNVIFLHRPDSVEDRAVPESDYSLFTNFCKGAMQYIVLNVAKQRQAKIGIVSCVFDSEKMLYKAIQRGD